MRMNARNVAMMVAAMGGANFARSIPVTHGADLITNGDFETWTDATTPGTWDKTVAGTTTVNRDNTNQYSGSYCARMDIDGAGSLALLGGVIAGQQLGNFYTTWFMAKASVSGKHIVINDQLGGNDQTFTLTDSYIEVEICSIATPSTTNGNIIKRLGGEPSISLYLDYVRHKKLDYTSAIKTQRRTPAGDCDVSVGITVPSGLQGGFVVNLGDPASPQQNAVYCYINRQASANTVKLVKYVGGTRTEVMSQAITYLDAKTLRVVKVGTTYQVFYNGAQAGADQTIADAGIVDNTLHMQFATSSKVSFDFFFSVASGLLGSLAWISDLHFGDADWSAGQTDAIADKIAAINPGYGLCTGDISSNSEVAEFNAYLAFIARSGKTFYSMPGNHDEITIANYNSAGLDHHFVLDYQGVRIIGFESTHLVNDPDYTGQVSSDELTWLETQMQGAAGKKIIVATHYPLLFDVNHQDLFTGKATVLALLQTYGARLFLSGHRHGNLETIVQAGTTHINGAAMVYTNVSSPGGLMTLDIYANHIFIKTLQNVSPWAVLHTALIDLQ